MAFQQLMVEQISLLKKKKSELEHQVTSNTKINSRWIIDLNIKLTLGSFNVERTKEKENIVHGLGVGKDFLEMK